MFIKVIDEGKVIKIVPKQFIKILGIFLDENLSWTRQISEVRKKSSNAIRNIHRVNKLVPIKQRILLHNALITPHFSYGDVIWGGCGIVNSRRLQITHNYAVKSILGRRKRDSATDAFKKLKFLNLTQRRQIHEVVFAYKGLNNELPKNLTKDYGNYHPTSNTRAAKAGKLNLPKHKMVKYEHSSLYRTITSWNSLPSHLTFDTVHQLKSRYQRLLIDRTHNGSMM